MTTTALTIKTMDGEPRVLDTDLATRLGMAVPRKIRTDLNDANRPELEGYGPLRRERLQTAYRPADAYYLNEEQALLIVMFARTPSAAEARREIIAAFQAWRRGELQAPIQPTFVIPQTLPEALRLAADAVEGRTKAEAAAALAVAEREQAEAGNAFAVRIAAWAGMG